MSLGRGGVVWLVALGVVACCTKRGDLHDPLIEVSANQFVCTHDLVVDADDRVWTNDGCEQGGDGDCWRDRGVIDHAVRASLEARVVAVAPEGTNALTFPCDTPPAGQIDSYRLSETTTHTGGGYCRASASAEANALVDDLLALGH